MIHAESDHKRGGRKGSRRKRVVTNERRREIPFLEKEKMR